MKKQLFHLLTVAFVLTNLTSCQKDDPKPASSKTGLLTAKAWKETDFKVDGKSAFDTVVKACDKDDLLKFNTDKSITFNEGALRCDPASPQTSMGSWDFTTSETVLKITDSDGKVLEGVIGTLTDTTLIITVPNLLSGTGTAVEVTYTAQ